MEIAPELELESLDQLLSKRSEEADSTNSISGEEKASATLAAVEQAPRGNPMQVVTPTPDPASKLEQSAVQHELMDTVLK